MIQVFDFINCFRILFGTCKFTAFNKKSYIVQPRCLRNVVSMFHVIEKEMQWRKNNNLPEGFEAMKNVKPIVAVGADKPLGDQTMLADYFRM